jgi:hypothetical protein
MWRLISAALVAIGLLVAAPAAVKASGAEVTTEITKSGTDTIAFVNPCTGETGTAEITFDAVFHQVNRPNDTFMLISKVVGSFVLDLDDPASADLEGHFVDTFVIAAGSNTANTHRLNATGVDENGAKFLLHFLERLTISATGHTVSFDKGC